jgi:hypothetical protein
VPRDVLIIAILILASSASFGLGYMAGRDAGQGTGSGGSPLAGVASDSPITVSSATGRFVASKSGTKYYLPGCAGADRISDANKVWFTSSSVARAAGYEPAENCSGL